MKLLTVILSLLIFCSTTLGNSLKGSLAIIPYYTENDNVGIYNDLLREYNKLSNTNITFKSYPYPRSIQNVAQSKADFHYPVAFTPNPLPPTVKYSSFATHKVTFVLFYKKGGPEINLDNMHQFKIEAIKPHKMQYFKEVASINEVPCVSCGLKKVAKGRIDGFVYEKLGGLELIKRDAIKGLSVKDLKTYDVGFLLPNNSKTKEIDATLKSLHTTAVKKGVFQNVLQDMFEAYKVQGLIIFD